MICQSELSCQYTGVGVFQKHDLLNPNENIYLLRYHLPRNRFDTRKSVII